MFVDSHCHLNYLDDVTRALQNAAAARVTGMLCIGVEAATIEAVVEISERHANVWATAGQHPTADGANAAWVAQYITHEKIVALGEMGLDYFRAPNAPEKNRQRRVFEQQLALARDAQLPVVIHTRAAEQDTLAMLGNFPGLAGVLHCFTESMSMAEQAMDMGLHISISGIVTFPKADNVRAVASRVPAERLLIETDAPWLAPVPHRGAQNEPAYVAATAATLAQLRGVSVQDLAAQTAANFGRLFDVTLPE